MPNLEDGVAAFLNSTAQCETVGCFQAATQFLDDNLLDVMSHVVGAQLGMEPVIVVRCQATSLGVLNVSLDHGTAY
jgi:hypothetical protein